MQVEIRDLEDRNQYAIKKLQVSEQALEQQKQSNNALNLVLPHSSHYSIIFSAL